MNRRGFLLGAGASLIAPPPIVRAASLMPVRGIVMPASPLSELLDLARRNPLLLHTFYKDAWIDWAHRVVYTDFNKPRIIRNRLTAS